MSMKPVSSAVLHRQPTGTSLGPTTIAMPLRRRMAERDGPLRTPDDPDVLALARPHYILILNKHLLAVAIEPVL